MTTKSNKRQELKVPSGEKIMPRDEFPSSPHEGGQQDDFTSNRAEKNAHRSASAFAKSASFTSPCKSAARDNTGSENAVRPFQDVPWTIEDRLELDSDDEIDCEEENLFPAKEQEPSGTLLATGKPVRPFQEIPWTIGRRVELSSDDQICTYKG